MTAKLNDVTFHTTNCLCLFFTATRQKDHEQLAEIMTARQLIKAKAIHCYGV